MDTDSDIWLNGIEADMTILHRIICTLFHWLSWESWDVGQDTATGLIEQKWLCHGCGRKWRN